MMQRCCNMQAKQAVGSGFPVLINSLKTERGDLEMMRGILESLALATQSDERSARMQVELPKHCQRLPCVGASLWGSCSSVIGSLVPCTNCFNQLDLQPCSSDCAMAAQHAALQGADPAAINAELLAKNDEVVPLLLGFLKDGPQAAMDFYVRYHTVQLLTALAAGGPYRLQRVSHISLTYTMTSASIAAGVCLAHSPAWTRSEGEYPA